MRWAWLPSRGSLVRIPRFPITFLLWFSLFHRFLFPNTTILLYAVEVSQYPPSQPQTFNLLLYKNHHVPKVIRFSHNLSLLYPPRDSVYSVPVACCRPCGNESWQKAHTCCQFTLWTYMYSVTIFTEMVGMDLSNTDTLGTMFWLLNVALEKCPD